MTEIVPVSRTGDLTTAEVTALRTFALAEKSDATRRAYQADWSMFTAWCHAWRNVEPLGASPETVVAFLAGQASVGVKPSTLTRRLAAIGYAHELAGLPSPTKAQSPHRPKNGQFAERRANMLQNSVAMGFSRATAYCNTQALVLIEGQLLSSKRRFAQQDKVGRF